MKGSLRIVLGLLLTLGAVGGIDNAVTNTELLQVAVVATMGLAFMYWGVRNLET